MAAEAELPVVRYVLRHELGRVRGVGVRRQAGRHHEKIVRANAVVVGGPRVPRPARGAVSICQACGRPAWQGDKGQGAKRSGGWWFPLDPACH